MSSTPAAPAQEAAPATPQAGDPPAPSQADAPPKLTPEQALAELAEARKEAAKYRTQLRGFEKAEADRKAAELTELERRDGRIRELEETVSGHERRARDYALRDAIAATIAGDQFPATPVIGTASLLRHLDADRVEWDERGAPRNVARLLADLTKAEPGLFTPKARRPGGGDGGYIASAPVRSGNDAINAFIRGDRGQG